MFFAGNPTYIEVVCLKDLTKLFAVFRYFMVGACQRGPSCPYSHDRSISRKGTLPCRFFQVGTCANGTDCRFSHGPSPGEPEAVSDPSGMSSLTIQMESFTFDQSEVGSEASLGSYEDSGVSLASGYPVLMDPSGGFTMEPVYETSGGYYPGSGEQQQQQPGYWSEYTGPASPVSVTLSPQVVVTVLPAPPPPHPCCDHTKSDQSSAPSTSFPASPSTLCDTRPDPPTLVPLTKTRPAQAAQATWTAPQDWAEAAEFVPGSVGGSEGGEVKPKSWAQVVNTGLTYPGMELSIGQAESLLCPFYKVGECRSVENDECSRKRLLKPKPTFENNFLLTSQVRRGLRLHPRGYL